LSGPVANSPKWRLALRDYRAVNPRLSLGH
jgi:hypothetical protein